LELICAAKPCFFDYFFKNTENLEEVVYFDSDVLVYTNLKELEDNLQKYNFVITPHILSPIDDGFGPSDKHILRAGIYNLGFIAVKKSDESQHFINWWKDRLYKYCYNRPNEGLVVDQNWINFLPVFFEKILIEKDLGYNVAYWNLHERIISQKDALFFVNDRIPLKFYHFSGFNPEHKNDISKHQNRYTFEQRQDLSVLFDEYTRLLYKYKHASFAKIKCFYSYSEEEKTPNLKKQILQNIKSRDGIGLRFILVECFKAWLFRDKK
jgi:hypothetical protein